MMVPTLVCCGVGMFTACWRGVLLFVVVVFSSQVQTIFTCPSDCFCPPHSKNVQCANKSFTKIPDEIPRETLELNMNENKFVNSGLTRANLSNFQELQNLYLSDCGIEAIGVGTFTDLPQLSWLDLSKNRIRFLADFTFRGLRLKHLFINDNAGMQLSTSSFAGMTTQGLYMNNCGLRRLTLDVMTPLNGSLKTLWLHGNSFQGLHDKWLYFLRRLAHVRLSGNSFHCNCQIVWLYTFYQQSKQSVFAGGDQPQCTSPGLVKDKKFDDLTADDFRCQLPTFCNVDAVFDKKIGKLTCRALGDPAPKLTWVRADGSTETFYLKADHVGQENTGLLLLTDSKFESKEMYKCVASNPAGNVTFSLNVGWPDIRLVQPLPPKTTSTAKPTAKAPKLSRSTATSSNDFAGDDTTRFPYKAFYNNYAGDDSRAYDWSGQSDRGRLAHVDRPQLTELEKRFGVVDLVGAVVGTFLVTLLVTVTTFHFCYRRQETLTPVHLHIMPDQFNNKRNHPGVYIMNETEDNRIKMINHHSNTDCPS